MDDQDRTAEACWGDVRETHIGVVFLLGKRAYKMKKPMTTGFLDFSSPERRLAACRREVELNRQLARDVYLGVSSVSALSCLTGWPPRQRRSAVESVSSGSAWGAAAAGSRPGGSGSNSMRARVPSSTAASPSSVRVSRQT